MKSDRVHPVRLLDWAVIAALLIISAATVLFVPTGGERRLLLLSPGETRTVGFEDAVYPFPEEGVIIEVKDGRARFIEADCPDQVCVKTGWVSSCGQAAICAPNRVAVVVSCEEAAIDAIAE